eukprot:scaffold21332_cov17-Tisochrysis_lutea.AAC.2
MTPFGGELVLLCHDHLFRPGQWCWRVNGATKGGCLTYTAAMCPGKLSGPICLGVQRGCLLPLDVSRLESVVPPAYAMPSVEIGEEDSFASVPQYPLASMELGELLEAMYAI